MLDNNQLNELFKEAARIKTEYQKLELLIEDFSKCLDILIGQKIQIKEGTQRKEYKSRERKFAKIEKAEYCDRDHKIKLMLSKYNTFWSGEDWQLCLDEVELVENDIYEDMFDNFVKELEPTLRKKSGLNIFSLVCSLYRKIAISDGSYTDNFLNFPYFLILDSDYQNIKNVILNLGVDPDNYNWQVGSNVIQIGRPCAALAFKNLVDLNAVALLSNKDILFKGDLNVFEKI